MVNKKLKGSAGFTLVDAVFVIVWLIIVLLVCFFVFHEVKHQNKTTPATTATTSSSSSSGTSSNPYATLTPATVASKTPECQQQITTASNGDTGPVQCTNGDLNITEWNALATLEPSVLTLGYSATQAQVQSALCSDVQATQSDANTTNASAIEATAYQIAALYYGWHFPSDPSSVLTNGGC